MNPNPRPVAHSLQRHRLPRQRRPAAPVAIPAPPPGSCGIVSRMEIATASLDESDARAAGRTVLVTNPDATRRIQSATTDPSGQFRFAVLPGGEYRFCRSPTDLIDERRLVYGEGRGKQRAASHYVRHGPTLTA